MDPVIGPAISEGLSFSCMRSESGDRDLFLGSRGRRYCGACRASGTLLGSPVAPSLCMSCGACSSWPVRCTFHGAGCHPRRLHHWARPCCLCGCCAALSFTASPFLAFHPV
ncbi:hypothetical protein K461DRAFT_136994 [Myriangium duriaei CBS 260.36]|uniref:Uncharacterized protein n=1 Tax=Myriangium duriaei CBS 260.36 TaxID=1168546 RepID=A0A9P4J1Y2_9PEZI|nr:hypothetical protein K461DRAFT_136994 [Myriangium duriaei CBS 260.36]